MKKMIIITAACVAMTTSAAAAEDSWTGPYIGVHAGYGAANARSDAILTDQWAFEAQALQDRAAANFSRKVKPDGLLFGAQIGYNQQIGSSFLLGAELEYSNLDAKDRVEQISTGAPTYTSIHRFDAKHSFNLKAKAGFTTGRTLIYGTAGWNWTRAAVGTELVSTGGYSKAGGIKKSFDGLVVGGGLEHKLSNNVSARLEYAFSDLGKERFSTAYRTGSTFTSPVYSEQLTEKFKIHAVKLGVNYNF